MDFFFNLFIALHIEDNNYFAVFDVTVIGHLKRTKFGVLKINAKYPCISCPLYIARSNFK